MMPKYQFAEPSDFEVLAEIRIDAMRESLENIGRFDRERSVARFRSSFSPPDTEIVSITHDVVGFYALSNHGDHLKLDHLYVSPEHQSRGIGTAVMSRVIERSNASRIPIRLGALRGSKANNFYHFHGFEYVSEDEWDIYYERPAPESANKKLNLISD